MFAFVVKDDQNTACLIELHYLPCINYLSLCFQYPHIYLERHEHYQKGSYRNRCYIGSAQGRQMLSVPLLKGKHQQQPMHEVSIAYHTSWHTQHWHAIETAYGSAPFFLHYGEALQDILYQRFEKLYDLNHAILQWLQKQAHASCQIHETAEYNPVSPEMMKDLRNTITPASEFPVTSYNQVFMDRLGFVPNLSALDLLMHLGPESYGYLSSPDI